jgi:hypothetical protein
MLTIINIIIVIILILLFSRLIYLYYDDTYILNIINRDDLYRTYYSNEKLLLNHTDDLDDDDYYKYLSKCESDILEIDNYLRRTELRINKGMDLSDKKLKKILKRIDYTFQRLGSISTFLFKIPILEELNDRITFYYKYMNDNKYIEINKIPIYQVSKHHHAVEYVYKNNKSNPGTILHIDTHADMNPIKNNKSFFQEYINDWDKNDKNMIDKYDDLITDIGGVLVPMLLPYENNNGVFWITPDWVTEPYNSSNVKISLNDRESYFYGGTCPKYTIKVDKDMDEGVDLDVHFTTSNIKYANHKINNISNNYILNIDLDYFVCFGNPLYGYEGNDAISHHRTILDFGYALKDENESEKKELELFYEMEYILKRIDNFLIFIKELKLQNKLPSMIIICDSTRINFSNYKNNKKNDCEIVHEFMPKYLCFLVHNIVLINLKKILE